MQPRFTVTVAHQRELNWVTVDGYEATTRADSWDVVGQCLLTQQIQVEKAESIDPFRSTLRTIVVLSNVGRKEGNGVQFAFQFDSIAPAVQSLPAGQPALQFATVNRMQLRSEPSRRGVSIGNRLATLHALPADRIAARRVARTKPAVAVGFDAAASSGSFLRGVTIAFHRTLPKASGLCCRNLS